MGRQRLARRLPWWGSWVAKGTFVVNLSVGHSVSARPARIVARLMASGAALALIAPGIARAAPEPQAPADAPQAAPQSEGLNDIVVTATRSGAQSLQKVPIAVSVVNVDQITKSGQGNLSDLAKFTPSLVITEGAPGFNKFNLRGLATGGYVTSDTSDRPLVAVYLDDTPISVQGQTPDLKVYDLDRVEVLRGPQGTLFGAGSMAGTVRFVTAKPDARSVFGTAEASGSTTEYGAGSYNVRGMVNIPLIKDELAVRGNIFVGNDGGFIDNIGQHRVDNANSNRSTQGRVAVRWTPTDRLTVDGSFTYENSRAKGLNTGLDGLKPYQYESNGAEGTRDLFKLYTGGFDYDAGFANLIVTGAYTDRKIGFNASPDPQIGYYFANYYAPYTGAGKYPLYAPPARYDHAVTSLIPAENYTINQKLNDFMAEARLVSKNDGPVKWTVGAFYEKQNRHLIQDIPVAGFDTLSYQNAAFGPLATPTGRYDSKTVDGAFSSNDIFSGLQDVHEHQFAAYADGTWHVTDRLDLTAGLRYFNFKENYYLYEGGAFGVLLGKDAQGRTTGITQSIRSTLKSNGVNPRANISYKLNDNVLIYAEAANGFRYGGANQPVPLGTAGLAGRCTTQLNSYGYSAAPGTFGPDKLWNYTIGEKAKFAGGRVTLNASAYYIDWSDVQTRLRLNCSYFFTDNKGKIASKGVELEAAVKATRNVTLNGSFSFNDSTARGDIPTVGAFDGDRTPYSPRVTASAGAFYDTDLGRGSLHLQATYKYISSQQTTFNDFSTTLDPTSKKLIVDRASNGGRSQTYAVIPASHNASASIAYDIGNYEFGIFGNNLFDGVKVIDIQRATYYAIYQAGSRVTYARPRTIGVRAKVKF
ncbi:TonB-dependent receptor [Sphingomonas glacialis]|uniref:TonB-dependent receptor n=1 Tax=Sphingomonas glacialis TaxID=658225 RepID=A0ABQ3LHX5_9SPHN|nr:TonB-dependent receptor [Sphingomonas glacialis]